MLNEVGAISPESCSLEYLENFTTFWKITLLFYSEDFFLSISGYLEETGVLMGPIFQGPQYLIL